MISQSVEGIDVDGRRKGETYGGYSEEHYNELFLAYNRMLNEGIGEADKASPTFFQEGRRVGCEMSPINFASLVSIDAEGILGVYIPATRFGRRSGKRLNGYLLCKQSSNHTKSLYLRTTLLPRRIDLTS